MTVNLKNERFNALVAIEPVRDEKRRLAWRCRCDCGGEKTVLTGTLRFKPPPNCGCKHMGRKHGHSPKNSKTWRAWNSMRQRCENPRTAAYANYGARGIVVCRRWHSFENFLADMGEAPPDLTLERVDNNGHYEPGNCEWRSRKAQGRNRRDNRLVTHRGETLCLAAWAERTGLKSNTIRNRLDSGWTTAEALTLPATKTNSVKREGSHH